MAIGEALTNLAAANVGELSRVSLSANWMAAAGHPGEDAALYRTVESVTQNLLPELGICIPVGKDSLSMKTRWRQDDVDREVIAPLSLIISAFSPVHDVRRTLTPQLRNDCGDTDLIFIDLGCGRNRLAGSALAQVFGQVGDCAPDIDAPAQLKAFFNTVQALVADDLILAYHDRSDGGLFVTLLEMAIAGNCGISVQLHSLAADDLAVLFNEELGAVLQIRSAQYAHIMHAFELAGLGDYLHTMGKLIEQPDFQIMRGAETVFSEPLVTLKSRWWQTSYQMQRLRDDPDCADEELAVIEDTSDPGLSPFLTFDPSAFAAPMLSTSAKPVVGILREQGVNGQIEMAAAFTEAGFSAIDIHMSDIISGRQTLESMQGIVACGGFSYGDVLGAGGGWAGAIRFNARANDQFSAFFTREDVFALGVCNGCQMFSHLKSIDTRR